MIGKSVGHYHISPGRIKRRTEPYSRPREACYTVTEGSRDSVLRRPFPCEEAPSRHRGPLPLPPGLEPVIDILPGQSVPGLTTGNRGARYHARAQIAEEIHARRIDRRRRIDRPDGAQCGGSGDRGGRLPVRHLRHAIPGIAEASGALPDLRGRAPVRRPGRPAVDDARTPPHDAQEHDQGGGGGPLLDQHRAEVRHRPAGLPDPDAQGQRPVGLRRADRRRDDRADQGAGRDRGDRDLAPALLHVDGRVEPRVRQRARSTSTRPSAPG